ncbi:hypothetical protein [Nocardia sp. NBC_01009]|uniref:hypothetical protein n=1 Tax=Nocardia sp. NBC_01009 TaxID=2975996 RepID=UPI0038699B3E|nr:hypothetical protein OHA42_33950 [Nocardia sp. NBC_01009]
MPRDPDDPAPPHIGPGVPPKRGRSTPPAPPSDPADPKILPGEPAPNGDSWWRLVPPPGASARFKAELMLAQRAIKTAIDLLGCGGPILPPRMDDLLKSAPGGSFGESQANEIYEKIEAFVAKLKQSLLHMDWKVHEASGTVADERKRALRAIHGIVARLKTELKAVGTAELKPAEETALWRRVEAALEAVFDQVDSVSEFNQDIADPGEKHPIGIGSATAATAATAAAANNGASGGGGGGGGGLDGLMQALMPLGMMAAPLIQSLPGLLNKEDGDKDAVDESGQTGSPQRDRNAASSAAVAVPTGLPAAQPIAAAAPVAGQVAQVSSVLNGSSTGQVAAGLPATPASAIARPAARTRRTTDPAKPADGAQADSTTDADDTAIEDAAVVETV